MPANRLAEHIRGELRIHADRLNAGTLTPTRFAGEMRRTLADAHTAAYMRGAADRLGIREGSALIRRGNLSRAERDTISAAVAKQDAFLRGFVSAIEAGELSPPQIAARAELYAGSVKATYAEARAPNLPFYPGDGDTVCGNNCKCSWQQRGDDWLWTLGPGEHCPDCIDRHDGNPYSTQQE